MSFYSDKQKAKDFKVAAVFLALINEIENWCQLGTIQPFLGLTATKNQFCSRGLWVLFVTPD